MEFVITKASSISCNHPPTGGGAVTLDAGQSMLKVDGELVLAKKLVKSAIASINCKLPIPPNGNKCSLTGKQTAELSKVLKVNGEFVLLESSKGATDGSPTAAPPPPIGWSVKKANQNLLRTD
jgi:hypothetical protein